MTAINFPDSPSNNDTHTVGGVTYTYNSTEAKWKTTINSNAFVPLSGGTVSGNIVLGGELQHSGDTDTKLHFDTDTIKLDTAGSERFRVGSAGQLGIGGATYGTSGQVLTSGGASAAPSWADADSGAEWIDGTSQNASGSNEVLFTGLPTNVREVVVTLMGVSWTTGSNLQFQLGDSNGLVGGSNYLHSYAYLSQGSTVAAGRTGSNAFVAGVWTSASHSVRGTITFTNTTGNTWIANGQLTSSWDNTQVQITGSLPLGNPLERIAIQNRAGNNFDAGTINIHYITT